ncbi:MAG: pseudouridine-5'-phosphate glycosidase [Ahrensia sp.]
MNFDIPMPVFSDEVAYAKRDGAPVVALESTIITHGMPWPQNLEMARSVEAIIRQRGAVPATIAVLNGRLHIGLDDAQAEALAKTEGAAKVSRADLAFAIARGQTAGTTVAATMMAAHMGAIAVFATGGIGGVHRGAELSFDVSADLDELSRTPVTVVSAGAKAILDIPKTLEVLETRGVPVIAYGQDALPAFWSRDSGLPAPLRLDSADAIAAFMAARNQMPKLGHGGILITNPVPADAEIARDEMEGYIAQAIAEADAAKVGGKAATPWLLKRIVELTGGKSLATNIALVENNAKLAAEIAVAFNKEREGRKIGFV